MNKIFLILVILSVKSYGQNELPLCVSKIDSTLKLTGSFSHDIFNDRIVWVGRNENKEYDIYLWEAHSNTVKNITSKLVEKTKYALSPLLRENSVLMLSGPDFVLSQDIKNNQDKSDILEYKADSIVNLTAKHDFEEIAIFDNRDAYMVADGKNIAWIGGRYKSDIKLLNGDSIRNITHNPTVRSIFRNLKMNGEQLIWQEVDYNNEPYYEHSLPTYVYWYNGKEVIPLNPPNTTEGRARNCGIVEDQAIWLVHGSGTYSGIYVSNGIKTTQILHTNSTSIRAKNTLNKFLFVCKDSVGSHSLFLFDKEGLINITSSKNRIIDFAISDNHIVWSEPIEVKGFKKTYQLYVYDGNDISAISNTKINQSHYRLKAHKNMCSWEYKGDIYMTHLNKVIEPK